VHAADRFQIGSVSKQFAAVAALLLAEAGALDLAGHIVAQVSGQQLAPTALAYDEP
jgi:CubicO group peptidase (beta-lactamase class C family)